MKEAVDGGAPAAVLMEVSRILSFTRHSFHARAYVDTYIIFTFVFLICNVLGQNIVSFVPDPLTKQQYKYSCMASEKVHKQTE